ncbi:MAG: bacterioferritin [Xanthobacteraceae bacterium]|nr:MAG: bacterioferritin [Xanthobacteraceae bacterium]
MIVCSCNVMSDHDIHNAVATAEVPPRRLVDVYNCAGAEPRCGRCAPTVNKVANVARQCRQGGG